MRTGKMKTNEWFIKNLEEFKFDTEFLTEELIIEFNEQIVKQMKKMNLKRVELAKKLGVSKAFITKLLNGNSNLTIKTMVALAKALDCKLDIDLCPLDYNSIKYYIPKINDINNSDFKTTIKTIEDEDVYAGIA